MKQALIASLIASSFAFTAHAATEYSASITGASDYVFNGVSQTDEKPAVQVSMGAAFDSGLYVGTWASNVDFGDDAQEEWDFYAGYTQDFGQGWNYDLMINQYTYVGESDYNYPEASASITAPTNTMLKVWYTWKQAGISNLDHTYIQLHQGYAINDIWGLEAAYTYNKALSGPGSDTFWAGKDHYSNWLLGVTASYKGFDFALNYQDTNMDDSSAYNADSRVVFSVTKAFSF
ncbi:TorF family putative porin [Gallaecimonas mangrovi]|uniref:TorF family putative porin n=1 Tax=Gallaecimonas mangrovi TaxID=2291597 RepID=UPI000E1FBAF1|nr:TorF family putative porin [Gallaecimonas mangrovi]